LDNLELKEIYIRYAPMIYRRCLYLLKNQELALEASQDVFLKFIDLKDNLKDKYLSSFFYKIASNHCINLIKKNNLYNKFDLNDFSINNNEDGSISKDILIKIFKNEKPKYISIAVSYFLDGMTLEELSKETNYSISGIRKILDKIKYKAKKIGKNL